MKQSLLAKKKRKKRRDKSREKLKDSDVSSHILSPEAFSRLLNKDNKYIWSSDISFATSAGIVGNNVGSFLQYVADNGLWSLNRTIR